MKISEWDAEFHHLVTWAFRMRSSRYEDDSKWTSCVDKLYEFDKELCYYCETTKKTNKLHYKITYKQLFDLTHKYIEQARQENNFIVGHFFFVLWCDLKHLFKEDKKNFILCDSRKFLRDATPEEIKYANENLIPNVDKDVYKDTVWYNKNTQVLTYRDINAPVDCVWGCAHILDEKGKVKGFSLDWDWWFLIDEYLDLDKGWKNED